MTRAELIALGKETVAEIKDDEVPTLAAAVAFRIFLSLFPSLLAGVAIYGLVADPAQLSQLLASARSILPGEIYELVDTQLVNLTTREGAAGVAAVIGVVLGVSAASGAAVAVMQALNRAYDVREQRKLIPARLTSLALIAGMFLALIALVLLLVAGKPIQDFLLPARLEESPVALLLGFARFLAAIVVLMLLFAFVYWAGPNRERPQWQWLTPGAVLGVVGWLVVSGGFAVYTRTAGNYNATYGALAGVVVLLLWLQLSMLVMLAGGELNSVIEHRKAGRDRAREGEGFGGVPAAEGIEPPTVPPAEIAPPRAAAALSAQRSVVIPEEQPARNGLGPRSAGGSSARLVAAVAAAAAMAGLVFLGLARRSGRRVRR